MEPQSIAVTSWPHPPYLRHHSINCSMFLEISLLFIEFIVFIYADKLYFSSVKWPSF